MTSMSPIMWTLVTGTKRFAPQNLPTSIWYCEGAPGRPRRARRRGSPAPRGSTPPDYSPLPGFGEKYLAYLSGTSFQASASGGGVPLRVMFGHFVAYSVFSLSHLSAWAIGIGHDRLGRALRLADAAVDALVRVDDQHVLALVEAVHGADFDAVHVLALDAGFGDDVGHCGLVSVVAGAGRRLSHSRGPAARTVLNAAR